MRGRHPVDLARGRRVARRAAGPVGRMALRLEPALGAATTR
jgi:hypothetical protein